MKTVSTLTLAIVAMLGTSSVMAAPPGGGHHGGAQALEINAPSIQIASIKSTLVNNQAEGNGTDATQNLASNSGKVQILSLIHI